MKKSTVLAVLVSIPTAVAAQVESPPTADTVVEDPGPPAHLVEAELARSRACVERLSRVVELNRDLEPLAARAARVRALGQAVALEDTTEVGPFDTTDALESAVRAWYFADVEMGRRYAESPDSALAERRRAEREAVLDRLREAGRAVAGEAEGKVAAAGDVETAALPCDDVILVRSAVLAVCDTTGGPVCAAARDTVGAELRFVDRAEDLWDLEEIRPWTDPGPLTVLPNGELGGTRTVTGARRGNFSVVVAFAPLIREREALAPEDLGGFDALLDSLEFVFEHPDLAMAPALSVQVRSYGSLGGETHYILHFGDLSNPDEQVVWTGPAGGEAPVQGAVRTSTRTLVALQRGAPLHLSAVALEAAAGEGATEGEVIFTVPLSPVGQSRAVGALLSYMRAELGRDLAELIPPKASGG